ncbi:MAG: hypothetical protein V3V84_07790 [Candidatus Bathyarchaeia archaeon]
MEFARKESRQPISARVPTTIKEQMTAIVKSNDNLTMNAVIEAFLLVGLKAYHSKHAKKEVAVAEKKALNKFVKPALYDIEEYFLSKQSTCQEAESFYNFYESNGWKVGRNKMKSWQGAASGWISRNNNNASGDSKPTLTDLMNDDSVRI